MLNAGTFDVVTSVSRTKDREEQCDFSLPIGRKKTVLSIRSDETRFVRGNYNTYKGLRVGQLSGNNQNDILEGKTRKITRALNKAIEMILKLTAF